MRGLIVVFILVAGSLFMWRHVVTSKREKKAAKKIIREIAFIITLAAIASIFLFAGSVSTTLKLF